MMLVLIPLASAASMGLAFLAFAEWRQREAARARALGLRTEGAAGSWKALAPALADIRLGLGGRLAAALPEAWRQALSERQRRAGQASALPLLLADMALAALLLALLGLLAGLGIYALLPLALGLALPLLRLNDAALRRQAALRKALPDALDQLCAVVEAGLGFDQALSRVAGRMRPGLLRSEFEAALARMALGMSRRDALKELEASAGLEELSQVISALLQADKRGVPLGPALRAQSGQLRVLRSLRVKKLAAEAPLKLLFPLMAFILPVVFIVLFGPIILKLKAGGF